MLRFALLLLILPLNVVSQSISGTIVCSETKDPIPSAHISIKGTATGTISNNKGSFTLNSKTLNRNDTLVFTHIGYEVMEIALDSAQNIVNDTIFLSAINYNLPEIIVGLDVFDYFKKILTKNNEMLRQDIVSKVYYRELLAEDEKNIKFADALMSSFIQKKGSNPEIYVDQSRIVDLPGQKESLFAGMLPFDVRQTLRLNDLEPLEPFIKKNKLYSFELQRNSSDSRREKILITGKDPSANKASCFCGEIFLNDGCIEYFRIFPSPSCKISFSIMGTTCLLTDFYKIYKLNRSEGFLQYEMGGYFYKMNITYKEMSNTISIRSEFVLVESLVKEKYSITERNLLKAKSVHRHGSSHTYDFWKEGFVPALDNEVKELILQSVTE